MDLRQNFLNVIIPPITILLLIILLPFYIFFKFVLWIKRRVCVQNVAGHVVLITGASSGIGEHLAYEYARRGARLALVARREDRLRSVADKSRQLGSPHVIIICGDVSKVDDCMRFIDETVNHFGKIDHLVNNAGIASSIRFEDYTEISDPVPVMNINFWGSINMTHFAIPHLKKSKGKIVVISSVAGLATTPKMSIYGASKAALTSFYTALRMELGSEIGITIVMPGFIESEITNPDFLAEVKQIKFREVTNFVAKIDKSEMKADSFLVESANRCAKAIVEGSCRGDRVLIEPSWYWPLILCTRVCPEITEWIISLK